MKSAENEFNGDTSDKGKSGVADGLHLACNYENDYFLLTKLSDRSLSEGRGQHIKYTKYTN